MLVIGHAVGDDRDPGLQYRNAAKNRNLLGLFACGPTRFHHKPHQDSPFLTVAEVLGILRGKSGVSPVGRLHKK